ncbi:hypothetical protein M885DRAFT_516835 [Pelagophyceae sp. CCMP2097]|nr:hypothetical protein M885DRAFT_516835 [Pelagophyceae sp. CCMP2097]
MGLRHSDVVAGTSSDRALDLATGPVSQGSCHRDRVTPVRGTFTGRLSREPCQRDRATGKLPQRRRHSDLATPDHGTPSQGPRHRDLVPGNVSRGPCHGDLATGTLSRGPRHGDLVSGDLPQGPCHGDLAIGTLSGPPRTSPVLDGPETDPRRTHAGPAVQRRRSSTAPRMSSKPPGWSDAPPGAVCGRPVGGDWLGLCWGS